jgi:protein-disulfide isomerase
MTILEERNDRRRGTTVTPKPVEPEHAQDHARGAATPQRTIIQYGDYDCPHTRAAQSTVDRLLSENQDVRIVFRHFPLRHLHANAEVLSRIAEAAHRQGKFWPMHDHLMGHRTAIDRRAVLEDARVVGIDIDTMTEMLEESELVARVEHDVTQGRESGVHSTPTFFFNGSIHDGHYDYATLWARLADARRRVT